jgi:hypothetical protein
MCGAHRLPRRRRPGGFFGGDVCVVNVRRSLSIQAYRFLTDQILRSNRRRPRYYASVFTFLAGLALANPACHAVSLEAALDKSLDSALAAYGELDVDQFALSLREAEGELTCLGAPLSAQTAAKYHRMTALLAYAEGDDTAVAAGVAASAFLEPGTGFPNGSLPPGFALQEQLVQAIPSDRTHRVARPVAAELWFDGAETRFRPVDAATVVQLHLAEGLWVNQVLQPGRPLPPYKQVPIVRNSLFLGTAALAIGAAVSVGAAATSYQAFNHPGPDVDEEDLRALRQRTNARSTIAVTFAAAGAATGTAALVVGRR